ncbi:MAG: hypothetical protein COB22_05840 [Cycloclasticus sp.]|nr:MAG: hypothetical protein COB22_05840 [Cycloclasticus sp.]
MFASRKIRSLNAINAIPVRVDATAEYAWGSAETGSVSFTYTGDSQAFVVCMGSRTNGGDSVTNVTFNGVSGTKIIEKAQGTGTNSAVVSTWVWIASELPTSTGTKTLTFTWSSNPSHTTVAVYSLSFVDQTTPHENEVSFGAFNLFINDTVDITLSNSINKFVISCVAAASGNDIDTTQNFDPPSQMTEDQDIGTNNKASITTAHEDECASASEVYTWTMKSTKSSDFKSSALAVFAINAA